MKNIVFTTLTMEKRAKGAPSTLMIKEARRVLLQHKDVIWAIFDQYCVEHNQLTHSAFLRLLKKANLEEEVKIARDIFSTGHSNYIEFTGFIRLLARAAAEQSITRPSRFASHLVACIVAGHPVVPPSVPEVTEDALRIIKEVTPRLRTLFMQYSTADVKYGERVITSTKFLQLVVAAFQVVPNLSSVKRCFSRVSNNHPLNWDSFVTVIAQIGSENYVDLEMLY